VPTVEKVSIALSSDMLRMVKEAVAGGFYASSSEVVREALREWKQRRANDVGGLAGFPVGGPLSLSAGLRESIGNRCREFGVRRLALFGSALRPDFAPGSDVDLTVEFGNPGAHSLVDQYFGFKSALESLLGRRVDLVELSAMPDSRLKRHILASQQLLHADSSAR
jgi:predicted nucleotidyltransferase